MASKKKTGTKSEQFNDEKNTEIRKKVGEITVETALSAVSAAQATIGKTLAGVGEQLQKQLQDLDVIKKAKELEQAEAERIHGVAAIALSVEEAEAAAEAKKEELDRDLAAHQVMLTDQKFDADRRLQSDIQLKRTEQERLNGQWTYEFELLKRDAASAFQEEQRQAQVAETVRKESLEKNWANREEGLKKQETEVVELRAKVAAFPEELSKAVTKAESIVGNVLKKDAAHEIAILNSRHAAEKLVSDNTIANLTAQLAAKDKLINDISTRLIASEEKVSNIATKALETAGNIKAIADVQSANALGAQNGSRKTQ